MTEARSPLMSGHDAAISSPKPVRVQRKRTKGWKMPPNTVSVTRPGPFGNPFRVGGFFKIGRGESHGGFQWLQVLRALADDSYTFVDTPERAVGLYSLYRRLYPLSAEEVAKLRGKNLACYCPLDQPCHADVLLEIANG